MRTPAEVERVERLSRTGAECFGDRAAYRDPEIHRSRMDQRARTGGAVESNCASATLGRSSCGGVLLPLRPVPRDGCISEHRRRVYRMRIALDSRYPRIISAAVAAIREV